jgi:hypothetical protein
VREREREREREILNNKRKVVPWMVMAGSGPKILKN